ncbi:MAG: flagellin [Alphaproteobacteria bacterium]|nr:flagellin [Alphaproteobacteria bacterium]
MVSVNTNYGALVALQNLTTTQNSLADVQDRINTGLKVSSARDDGAVFAIAQDQRGRLNAQQILRDAMDRAISTIDVGLSAAEAVQNILQQMKDKALAASAPGLTTAQIASYKNDFDALRDAIDPLVNAAQLNGQNLINDSTVSMQVKVNDLNLSTVITITGQGLTTASLSINTLTFTTAAEASTAVSTIIGVMSTMNASLSVLGGKAKALTVMKEFNSKMSDVTEKGVGVLVDADLARESARLQSLQVKQQLGAQALSIANQQPQILLRFFQGG